MNEPTKTEQELREAADEFWEECEMKAAELVITVDYYLEEFYC